MKHDPEMIERVARAICKSTGTDPDHCRAGAGDNQGNYECYMYEWESFAIAAQAALDAAFQWRDIETAPKDGTPVLATAGKNSPWLIRWNNKTGPRTPERWECAGLGAVRWSPKWWLPLPTPPEED